MTQAHPVAFEKLPHRKYRKEEAVEQSEVLKQACRKQAGIISALKVTYPNSEHLVHPPPRRLCVHPDCRVESSLKGRSPWCWRTAATDLSPWCIARLRGLSGFPELSWWVEIREEALLQRSRWSWPSENQWLLNAADFLLGFLWMMSVLKIEHRWAGRRCNERWRCTSLWCNYKDSLLPFHQRRKLCKHAHSSVYSKHLLKSLSTNYRMIQVFKRQGVFMFVTKAHKKRLILHVFLVEISYACV